MAQHKEPAATGAASKPRKNLLRRRIDLPGKPARQGALAKDVRAPGWLRRFGGYFKGAYREVRQVRWPTRRATWGMTGAVLVFTAVMVAFVLALDFGFETLLKRIIT